MRIGITDSGVGGLSVCAAVEAKLRNSPFQEDIELLYLNAAIEDDYSYNSMPDRQTKLEAFDRFLNSVFERYRLDLLFIACNTLSVLYQDPWFDHYRHIPIKGIVDTGARQMLAAFEQENDLRIIVFATPTTIEEGVYGDRLLENRVPQQQFIEQACPGLPDAISNDDSGRLAANLLKEYVPAALRRFNETPEKVLAFLGCTHYGYQAIEFERALQALVKKTRVMNPNIGAAESILSNLNTRAGNGSMEVRFITRYAIPAVVIKSLSVYLGKNAPATLAALKGYTLIPELCG